MPQLEESILALVNSDGYRPIKPRVIAQRLNVPKDQAVDVRKAVKRLVHAGRLAYSVNHLVTPVASSTSSIKTKNSRGPTARGESAAREASPKKSASNRVLGVFQRTQKGFGFVRLDRVEGATEAAKDVYIPADRSADAATGDVVLVELNRPRRGEPGPRGAIVKIVERQTHEFVGTYFEQAGSAYVRIDGTLFARPIYVGDPGAKNAQPDDKVVIEMLHFPSPLRNGEGVVAEVLGARARRASIRFRSSASSTCPTASPTTPSRRRTGRPMRSTSRSARAPTSPARRSSRSTRSMPAISTTPFRSNG